MVRTAWGLPDDDDGSSVIEKIIISLSFLAAELLLSFRTSSHSNDTSSNTILQLYRNSSEGVTKFASTALQSKTITRAINILLSLQSGRLPLGAEHYCEPKMGQFWPLALAHTTKGRTIGHSLLGYEDIFDRCRPITKEPNFSPESPSGIRRITSTTVRSVRAAGHFRFPAEFWAKKNHTLLSH